MGITATIVLTSATPDLPALPENVATYTIIGAFGIVAVLLFRSLWRTDGTWLALVRAAREDAAQARRETAELRKDLTEVRRANARCEAEHADTRHELEQLRDQLRSCGIDIPDNQ